MRAPRDTRRSRGGGERWCAASRPTGASAGEPQPELRASARAGAREAARGGRALGRRERATSPRAARRGALDEQDASVARRDGRGEEDAVERGASRGGAEIARASPRAGRAESARRGRRAQSGRASRADLLAEVHERRREVAGISRGQERPRRAGAASSVCARVPASPSTAKSRETTRVTLASRAGTRAAERERRHGGGHVVAESGQRGERRRVARNPSRRARRRCVAPRRAGSGPGRSTRGPTRRPARSIRAPGRARAGSGKRARNAS